MPPGGGQGAGPKTTCVVTVLVKTMAERALQISQWWHQFFIYRFSAKSMHQNSSTISTISTETRHDLDKESGSVGLPVSRDGVIGTVGLDLPFGTYGNTRPGSNLLLASQRETGVNAGRFLGSPLFRALEVHRGIRHRASEEFDGAMHGNITQETSKHRHRWAETLRLLVRGLAHGCGGSWTQSPAHIRPRQVAQPVHTGRNMAIST